MENHKTEKVPSWLGRAYICIASSNQGGQLESRCDRLNTQKARLSNVAPQLRLSGFQHAVGTAGNSNFDSNEKK